jgi:acyl-CoA dehydrogenase
MSMPRRTVFSAEHETYRQSVRRFFAEEVEPSIQRWERQGSMDRTVVQKAGERGLLSPHIPVEYGGGGGDLLHQIVLWEEHGYSTAGAAFGSGLTADIIPQMILSCGTEVQKKHWLPLYASGKVLSDGLFTESHSGSDVASIKTSAHRDGDHYIVNGSKTWVTHSHLSEVFPTLVRTGGPGTKGLSLLMIDPMLSGVEVLKPIDTMCRGASNLGTVYFDHVRVPASELLGGVEGQGMSQMLSMVTIARVALAARMLAACELAFSMTVDLVKNREAFGKKIFDFQNTQFALASMKTEISVGRAFVDSLLVRLNDNAVSDAESSMAKLWVSELEGRIMDQAVQLHGAMGFANENPISKMYTSARAHRIFLGTSEIHRIIISRSI